MSGQKVSYVDITTEEYSRLMRSARVSENMDSKIQNELRKKEANLKRQFDSQLNKINQRNNTQNNMISNLSSEMQNMERDFQKQYKKQSIKHTQDVKQINNNMRSMERDFRKEQQNQSNRHKTDIRNIKSQIEKNNERINKKFSFIQNTISNQRKEYKSLINEQNKVLNQRISKQGEIFNQKIKSLEKSIKDKEKYQKNQALEWLKNAKDALALVDTYNHEKFAPNEYNDLKQRISLIDSNIKNGNYELSNSQNIWMDSYKLRARLEELENEWNTYLQLSQQSNAELLASCEAHEIVKIAFDTEEETIELEADIDKWCNGELTELKNKALEHQKTLQQTEDLKIDNFKKILEESYYINEEVVALTQKAKEAIILSQKRSDMASDIVESLDESGFEIVDSCFEEEDERKAIHLKLQNISGDEVVTIITPVNNKENKLDIHFFDDNDESFKQTRLSSILQRLQQDGIRCSTPQCVTGTEHQNRGNEQVRDFDKMKRGLR